jgi:hypothetical protein
VVIKIVPSEKKFDKKPIDELENRIGLSFPKEYISFLQKFNGGVPEDNFVELKIRDCTHLWLYLFWGQP